MSTSLSLLLCPFEVWIFFRVSSQLYNVELSFSGTWKASLWNVIIKEDTDSNSPLLWEVRGLTSVMFFFKVFKLLPVIRKGGSLLSLWVCPVSKSAVLQSLKCQVFKILSLSASTELSSDYAWVSPTANTLNNISSLFNFGTVFCYDIYLKNTWNKWASIEALGPNFSLLPWLLIYTVIFSYFPLSWIGKTLYYLWEWIGSRKIKPFCWHLFYMDMTVQEKRASSSNSANL